MVRIDLICLGAAAFCASLFGQSALDGFNPNANGAIRVVVVQPDGKILIGGAFTTLAPNGRPTITRNHIARLNPDGTVDAGFDPNANGVVRSIVVQADGKIVVGGEFNGPDSIGGQSRNRIARLDAVTGADDSFDPNANNTVFALALQPDGKILAGGDFTGANSVGGQSRNNIARIDPTTGLADSFNPSGDGRVLSIVRQPDGKTLVGGEFRAMGGQNRNRIARLDPVSGSADSFDPNASNSVFAIALQADGKILVGGFFNGANSIGGQAREHVARLDPVTGLADSFNPSADARVLSVVVQQDGKILAGGDFLTIGGESRERAARLDPVSGLPDSVDQHTSSRVYSITLQSDGKILIAGNGGIVRLNADGSPDQAGEVQLSDVVSRKMHGGVPFDVDLPNDGNGIECRDTGDGNYQLVFSFANTLANVGNASVTGGIGNVSSRMIDADAHNYIVNLTEVTNAQSVTVALTNVDDSMGASSASVPITFKVLQGDTTGDGTVNSADIGQTKSKSGQAVDATNFRNDVNADGTLNSGDIGLVKSRSGTGFSIGEHRSLSLRQAELLRPPLKRAGRY